MEKSKYDTDYLVIAICLIIGLISLKLPQPWLTVIEIPCLLMLGVGVKKAFISHRKNIVEKQGFSIPYQETERVKSNSAEGIALWFIAFFVGVCAKEFIAFYIKDDLLLELFIFALTSLSSSLLIRRLARPS